MSAGNAVLDEIWEWEGVTWARAGARLPTAVSAAAAAFDVDSLSVVVVGGDTGVAVTDAVISISSSGVVAVGGARPPARRHGGLTVRDDGAIVLFGGEGAAADLDDTWLFQGGGFSQLSVTPPPGAAAALEQPVIATVDGEVFIFAGILNKTYRLGSSAWIDEDADRRPGARIGLRAASTTDEVLLFGGAFDDATSTQRFSDHRFNVVNANRLPTAQGSQLAYDVVDDVIVAVSLQHRPRHRRLCLRRRRRRRPPQRRQPRRHQQRARHQLADGKRSLGATVAGGLDGRGPGL